MKKSIAILSLLGVALAAKADFSVDVSALYVLPDIDDSYASTVSPVGDDDFDDEFGFAIKTSYEFGESGFSIGPEFLYFGTEADSIFTGNSLLDGIQSGIDSEAINDLIDGIQDFDAQGLNALDTGFSSDEEFDFYGGMINVTYDLAFKKLDLVVGAGVGYIYAEHSYSWNGVLLGGEGELLSTEDEDGAFAYQFLLGLNFNFTDSLAGFASYRYLAMEDFDFDMGTLTDGPIGSNISLPDYEASVAAHAFEIGVTLNF